MRKDPKRAARLLTGWTANPNVSGKGGVWCIGHEGVLVLMQFLPEDEDAPAVFSVEVPPSVAVRVAQAIVKHALAAGYDEPITLTFGDTNEIPPGHWSHETPP